LYPLSAYVWMLTTGLDTRKQMYLVSSTCLILQQQCGQALASHRFSMAGNQAVPDSSILLQLAGQRVLQLIIWLLQ